MGLFDTVFATNTGSVDLTPAEAVGAVALVAVAYDGHISSEEINTVWATLSRMQLFRNYSDDVVGRMFNKLSGLLKRLGVETLLQLAKESLPYELGPTVFAIATDLVFADGSVTSDEEQLLEYLYSLLGVPQNVAVQIIQVMAIKNKG
jgi:tellurite resistance protein